MSVITIPQPRTTPMLRGALLTAGGLIAGALAGIVVLALVATRFFDYQVLTVSTGSMAPAINAGDLIIVRPVAITSVDAGDVVVFVQGGDEIPTVHRVAGINEVELRITDRATGTVEVQREPRLVTQGDANPAPDRDEVTGDRLRGEVWFTVPKAGGFLGAGLWIWFVFAFVAILVVWAGYEAAARLRPRAVQL